MNKFYGLLNKHQINNIYKQRRKYIGQYFALWAENSHLTPYLITLTPSTNTLAATMTLRKDFFKKINNYKNPRVKKLAYFSAIEIGINKNPPSKKAQITQAQRMKLTQKNFHLHIQVWTDMKKAEIQKVIDKVYLRLPNAINNIQHPKVKGAKYDYVIKDLKKIHWELQYIRITQMSDKKLYTQSHKEIANYMIKKLWEFMKQKYKNKWTSVADKYSLVLALKKKGDLILTTHQNSNNLGINLSGFDMVNVNTGNNLIYVKKGVL